MSAIFGLFHTDQAPIDRQDVARMQKALAAWGPDGQEVLAAGNVCLGQQMFMNTPEARYEALPCETDEGFLLTAAARLDNRDDLCEQFGIAGDDRARTPDSALIARAYRQWGEACPDYLLGDWSFAIFDPRRQKLFMARDQLGNTGLYYAQDGRRFVFASSRRALLAVGVPRRLNELFVAQLLISWPAYHGAHTVDLDIMRLPPAHAMTVTPEETRVWQYWRLADTPVVRPASFDDYVHGFVDVYDEAVRCRLRSAGAVGVTLSGGLDSGSVTALAARALREKDQRLAAFTSTPLYDVQHTVGPNRFGNELAFARATAEHCGNVDLYAVTGAGLTPVAGLREVISLLQEPVFAASNFFWIFELLRMAQGKGVTTMLTGQGGNATVSWVGRPEFGSLRLLQERHGWKALVKYLLPIPLLRLAMQMNSLRQEWRHTAIHPDYARRIRLGQRRAATIGRDDSLLDDVKDAREWRMRVLQPDTNMVGGIWSETGAAFQMEIRDPTLDRRVVAYTFSAPDDLFVGTDGLDRRLIREAMAGLLPDEVRLNRLRGRQSADLAFRLQESADEVAQALGELAQGAAAEYVDVERMRQVWAAVQREATLETTHRAMTILLRGLSVGLFLNETG